MIIDFSRTRIFLRPGATDMRKQINGLAAVVEQLGEDPFGERLYVFCSRDRSRLKAIYWDTNGFWLLHKRLERQKFPWPNTAEEVREISESELRMLLRGIDFFHVHERLDYRMVN
jgi:transposase